MQLVNWRLVEQRLYKEELHFDIKDPNKAAWHEVLDSERMIGYMRSHDVTCGYMRSDAVTRGCRRSTSS